RRQQQRQRSQRDYNNGGNRDRKKAQCFNSAGQPEPCGTGMRAAQTFPRCPERNGKNHNEGEVPETKQEISKLHSRRTVLMIGHGNVRRRTHAMPSLPAPPSERQSLPSGNTQSS